MSGSTSAQDLTTSSESTCKDKAEISTHGGEEWVMLFIYIQWVKSSSQADYLDHYLPSTANLSLMDGLNALLICQNSRKGIEPKSVACCLNFSARAWYVIVLLTNHVDNTGEKHSFTEFTQTNLDSLEDLSTRLRTLSYEHERLTKSHLQVQTANRRLQTEVEGWKAKCVEGEKKRLTEENKVKELREESARGRKALEGVRLAALVS